MSKGKILVADDEISIRQIVEARLKMAGYEVVTAADGAEAIDLIKAEQPSLIVLDIMMPKMDVLQVCREVIKNLTTTIIMLTAKGYVFD